MAWETLPMSWRMPGSRKKRDTGTPQGRRMSGQGPNKWIIATGRMHTCNLSAICALGRLGQTRLPETVYGLLICDNTGGQNHTMMAQTMETTPISTRPRISPPLWRVRWQISKASRGGALRTTGVKMTMSSSGLSRHSGILVDRVGSRTVPCGKLEMNGLCLLADI